MAIVTCPNCGAKNRIEPNRAQKAQPVCGRCKQPLPRDPVRADQPVVLTDQTFESALARAGNRPVLVDCWAPWCGPCRTVAPVIDELAAESNGKYVVGKLNTDKNPRTAARFNISAIPTLLIFRNGRLADQLVGVQPKRAIVQRLVAQTT